MSEMKIAITGASGLVGRALAAALGETGIRVLPMVRRAARVAGEIPWSAAGGIEQEAALAGCSAVVHLAGENIAGGRWTAARKARIRDSRVHGTATVARALAEMKGGPRVLVCASAIGYYGDRGDEVLTESSAAADDFLADVCRQWEAAADPARAAGVRVVHARFGMILSADGGALPQMLTPFKLGLGGRLGNGRQYMSWIAMDDVVEVLRKVLREDVEGPVNVVAPAPVTNADFTRALGRVLRRPTIFPMPAMAARLIFGEMADALLLSSTRVQPARLEADGHVFQHPEIEGALRHVLERPA